MSGLGDQRSPDSPTLANVCGASYYWAVSTANESSAQGRDYGSSPYRWYVLITLTLVYALNFIDRALLGVLAQPVITTFGLTDTQFGFLAGPPFALFYALMGIPIAMAADRYNRVAIVSFCIALWSLMTALCGLATGFLFLLISRIGVAIGEAGSNPPSNSIIADYFRPSARPKALSVYSTGVTLGSMLAFLIGGPLGQLSDERVIAVLSTFGLGWMPEALGWGGGYGWRFAFLALGVPGVICGLIVFLTVREPPRGWSDPPGIAAPERTGIGPTLNLLMQKRSFWFMAVTASLVAMVGYGYSAFQAPMMQRLHGLSPAEFALRFGVPIGIAGAIGTITAGYLTERLVRRSVDWVAKLPAIMLALATPLYLLGFIQKTENLELSFAFWVLASMMHYGFLGAQYTIGQGVVPQSSRASAIAILLVIIALVGNGIGPQLVGWLSDTFMNLELESRGLADTLSIALCNPKAAAALSASEQLTCAEIYAVGLQHSMMATALFLLVAACSLWICAKTLDRDLLAR